MAIMSETIGKLISDALGLNSAKVQNIDIRIHAGEIVRVFVQMAPTIDEVGQITRVLKHYTLHDEDPNAET